MTIEELYKEVKRLYTKYPNDTEVTIAKCSKQRTANNSFNIKEICGGWYPYEGYSIMIHSDSLLVEYSTIGLQ